MLASDRMIRFPNVPWSIHVKDVEQLCVAEVVFKQMNPGGEIDLVVWAKEGNLSVDVQRNVLLLHLRAGKTIAANGARGAFDDKVYDLPLPNHLFE
jgi:hypothetical protein